MWEKSTLQADVGHALAEKAAIEQKASDLRVYELETQMIDVLAKIALLELQIKRIKKHVKLD
jgi:hypothetical protein